MRKNRPIPDLLISDKKSFDKQIDKTSHPMGCWIWTGNRNDKCYGRFFVKDDLYLAHRVSWELANEAKIPEGMVVMHKCDNPPCVNPNHLQIGTPSENYQDALNKRRVSPYKKPRTQKKKQRPRSSWSKMKETPLRHYV